MKHLIADVSKLFLVESLAICGHDAHVHGTSPAGDLTADASKPNMGLTSWREAKVRKQDVTIAKNYLNEEELAALNNLVEQYLLFAEVRAMRRISMHMADWI